MKRRGTQAFKQAPWRAQLRFTGGSMLPLITLLVVGGIYLAVNARLARTGRKVIDLQKERANLLRQNAELTSSFAELTTPERMMERALALGFEPAEAEDIEYFLVEGYTESAPFEAPRPPASTDLGVGRLSPAYTETLGEWLIRWLGLEVEGDR